MERHVGNNEKLGCDYADRQDTVGPQQRSLTHPAPGSLFSEAIFDSGNDNSFVIIHCPNGSVQGVDCFKNNLASNYIVQEHWRAR